MAKRITADTFMSEPPVRWTSLYEALQTGANVLGIVNAASHQAIGLIRLSAYIEHRFNGGDHAGAVKAQNRAVRKVRKVLGYTYPHAADVTF